MKHLLIGLIVLTGIPAACFGQNGSDINQAIPIYFGQITDDLGDINSLPRRVYSITLAKGQQVSGTLTSPQGAVALSLYSSAKLSVAGVDYGGSGAGSVVSSASGGGNSATWTYTVVTAGTYYVVAYFNRVGTHYSLQINAVGTPLLSPLPAQSGCLTGQIDSITYSLQLVSANIPDSASIGGTQMCGSCTVKPPAYPALVDKMEKAMGLNVGVSACYDSSGNIFQLKLMHP
jgi:hypothetical protein